MDLTALLLFQIQFGASRPEQTGSLHRFTRPQSIRKGIYGRTIRLFR
jgi:hypothetical protein